MGEFKDFNYQGFKYKLYIPDKYKPENEFPLMVMLHGCEQDPDDFAAGTDMNALAEQENFLVLYPNMNHLFNPSDPAGYNPFGCWNWFLDKNQHRGKGHPKLIYEIINVVKSEFNIDSNKVYAAGLSAGGSLACILGVTYPDVFSGIGICAGLAYDAANVFFLTDPMAEDAKKSMEKGVPDPYACGNSAFQEMGEFKNKMPVIVFHGVSDTTVHPINAQQVITQWAQTNFLVEGGKGNVDVTPALVKADILNGKSYTRHVYNDGSGKPLLELWLIDKMGHAWSGGSPNGSYTDPNGPNATEIIWNFFTKPQTVPEEKIEIPDDHSWEAYVESLSETPIEAPAELLVPSTTRSIVHSNDQSSVQSTALLPEQSTVQPPVEPVERSVHAPTESPVQSPEPSPIESLVKLPEESRGELPKKNLFRALLSKLTKKKR